MNIEKLIKSLEELIRRKDSGVFFGVFGIGNILGKESVYTDNGGRAHYRFFPERGVMDYGEGVLPYDVDSSLTINTPDKKWFAFGEDLPFFQKKVLEQRTEEDIVRIVKQNVMGRNPHKDQNCDTEECWALAKYLSDSRGGNSYSIGIKAKLKNSYNKDEINFLNQIYNFQDEDFIEFMDKIANIFIPKYHQAIKGWTEYFK